MQPSQSESMTKVPRKMEGIPRELLGQFRVTTGNKPPKKKSHGCRHPGTTPAVSPSNVSDGSSFDLPPTPVSSSAGPSVTSREASQVFHYGLTTLVSPTRLDRSLPDQPTPAHSPTPFSFSYVRDRNSSAPAGEREHSLQRRNPTHLELASFANGQRSSTSPGLPFVPQPPPEYQLSPSEAEYLKMRGLLEEMSIEFDPSEISITHEDSSDTGASNDSESFEN